jgi:hypothetical protein
MKQKLCQKAKAGYGLCERCEGLQKSAVLHADVRKKAGLLTGFGNGS